MFTDIGYTLSPGEIKIFETEIEDYFPDLKKGRYRISKSYFYQKDIPVAMDKEQWIYQEFIIEKIGAQILFAHFFMQFVLLTVQ